MQVVEALKASGEIEQTDLEDVMNSLSGLRQKYDKTETDLEQQISELNKNYSAAASSSPSRA